MRKFKKFGSKYIEIHLAIYRCHVLVSWEKDIDKIIKYAKKRGVKISNDWKGTFQECQRNANGVCMTLGDDNTDVLVWLKIRPTKASEFGTLYHELYHAVDHISEGHNLEKEREARAYLYEYLAEKCNQVLWG